MLKDQFQLDPQVIFLNHGSFGACPKPVFDVYQAWQHKLETQPVQFLGVELDNLLRQSRQALGQYVHAASENLVYVPNATFGVNLIARSLHLVPGDEILTTDQEYGACNYVWDFICRKTGAVYRQQPIRLPAMTAEEIFQQFWQGVTPRTRVIFLSHITSPTALTMPIDQICQHARGAGILTLIDGAHAPGQIPLDLSLLQADFYTGNCHKWMLSPKGAGFLYARQEVQHLVEPLIVSWGYREPFTKVCESPFIDLLQWSGTHDPAAALSVPAAIAFMQANHWEDIQLSCHNLLHDALNMMSDLTNLPPLYPLESNLYQQMGTIPLPQMRDLTELKRRLYADYMIEIPVIDWNRHHYLRLSVQGYNSEHDIDIFANAMTELLPLMQC
jgi:isopenicillin-N epimerase